MPDFRSTQQAIAKVLRQPRQQKYGVQPGVFARLFGIVE